MKKIVRSVVANVKNIPGWKTSRQLIVFESDDWGGERMPSAKVRNTLIAEGIINKAGNYDRLDSIEQKEDLEMLFDVLNRYKDSKGNAAVISPFVNTCNPDYDKIRQGGFEKYYAEPFNITLSHKGAETETMAAWKQGIDSGIFMPEYHGREHLNVHAWMNMLRQNNPVVRKAFDYGFYAPRVHELKDIIQSFRPTYFFDTTDEVPSLNESTADGLKTFEALFGRKAVSFVPPNGIYSNLCDEALSESGISAIGTSHVRDVPDGKGGLRKKYFVSGMKSRSGQVYYIRNAQFEPALGKGINQCLASIEAAFRWNKPAVISTHRINYIGSLDPENRKKSLDQLGKLLTEITKKWPDSEFISTAELLRIMAK